MTNLVQEDTETLTYTIPTDVDISIADEVRLVVRHRQEGKVLEEPATVTPDTQEVEYELNSTETTKVGVNEYEWVVDLGTDVNGNPVQQTFPKNNTLSFNVRESLS